MRTVQPSIMIGSYVWDQDRVPRDEFQLRLDELNRIMDAKGFKAMLVYGDAAEHSALAYFSNFAPRLRWGMALLPRAGEPRLLISMSSRDVPAMKLMTWIPDVLSGWNWESGFDPWLARLQADDSVNLGTVGFDLMRPPLFQSLEKSLGNRFRLQRADVDVSGARTLRPRERSLIREAASVAQASGAAIVRAWRDGMAPEGAALAGERTARLMVAQDVRTLASLDAGRTLVPFRGAFETQTDPLVVYIAVKHAGYWADMFVSAASAASDVAQRTRAALEVMLSGAGPGMTAHELYANALAALGPHALHTVLSGSVGHRIGLSPNEGGEITREARHALAAGEVYAFHIGAYDPKAGGALTSAMIAVTGKGAEILHRSPEPLHP
jgi:Xaa-Pro aminopeptidase